MTQPPIVHSPWKFTLLSTKSVRLWILLCVFGVIIATVFGRVKIFLVQSITNTAIAASNSQVPYSTLWKLAVIYAVVQFLNSIIWRFSGFAGMRWITKTKANINQNLFNYLSRHSVSYFHNRFAGALANKISNVANGFASIAGEAMWNFFPLLIGLFADLYLTYNTHYLLSLILSGWMILFVAINIFLGVKLKRYYYQDANSGSKLKGKMIDSTGNILSVQTAPGVFFEQKHISRYVKISQLRHLKSWYEAEWVLVYNAILIAVFMLMMLCACVYLLQANLISVGSIVMIVAILVSLERGLFFLGNAITTTLQNYGQMQEGLDDILLPYEIQDKFSDQQLIVASGGIEFRDLSFGYNQDKVFKHLNIKVNPGEKVGLVGLSGAGKSTLVSLLLRQHNLDSGQILIDQQDIAKVSLDSLRTNIGYVPQNTELFHRTIFDNIRYGSFKATESNVREAAEQAFAADFIESFPQKYFTYVGERGVKLSGGQRQRIAIARAFLKNSPILVLDEATSALDSESEAVIQTALSKLMKGKTVIAIAHRLSTLQMMDRILVIDQGQLMESGTHQELLAQQGLYSRIWERQVSGFIQD